MQKLLIMGLILSLTASCNLVRNTAGAIGVGEASVKKSQVESDGVRYRSRVTADGDDKRLITITVSPVTEDPTGAKEAGRYAATRYCLLTYGGSDTDWISGPDEVTSDLLNDDGGLTMQGRCTQR